MKLRVNGKDIDTSAGSLNELKEEFGYAGKEVVVIKNGYQTSDNLSLHDNDTVVFIKKGVMPESLELQEMMRSRHTPGVYDAVKNAHVAIAGLGGLGSNIAIMLARTGVGYIHLIDFDVVEPSNLNRQQYMIAQLGQYKTEAMQEIIKQINPFLHITTDCVRVTEENAQDLFANDTYICEAFDNVESKSLITDAVMGQNDKYLVAASGMAGIGSSNKIKTKKVTDRLYICGDMVTGAQEGRGLMSPRVTLCAAHQANMIISLITGQND